jgi:hypothetical protein
MPVLSPRDPIYFTFVRLSDGALASLTIIRKRYEFVAQLASYGFTESVTAPTLEAWAFPTVYFLEAVAGAIKTRLGHTYTYEIPDGMTWAKWLAGFEERAHDPRFAVFERNGALAYSMTPPEEFR